MNGLMKTLRCQTIAQGGKSMTMENAVGWKLDTDPEPILYICPTKTNAD